MKRFVFPFAFAALASAVQADVTLHATLTSQVTINDGLFAYQPPAGAGNPGAAPLDQIVAGVRYDQDATVPGTLSDYANYRYTVIGTYGTTPGIVIAMNPTAASAAIGQSFDSVFNDISESSLVTDVQGAHRYAMGSTNFFDELDAYSAAQFLSNHLDKLAQGTDGGVLVSFSNGANVGSLVAAPVPEPASMAVLGLGAAALLRRRRRA